MFWQNQGDPPRRVVSTVILSCTCGLTNPLQLTEFQRSPPDSAFVFARWYIENDGKVNLQIFNYAPFLGLTHAIIISAAIEIYGLNLGDRDLHHSQRMWNRWYICDSECRLPDPNFSYHFGAPPPADDVQRRLQTLSNRSLHQYKIKFHSWQEPDSHMLHCDFNPSTDGPKFRIRYEESDNRLEFQKTEGPDRYKPFASFYLGQNDVEFGTVRGLRRRPVPVLEWVYYNDRPGYYGWYNLISPYLKFTYLTID